MFVEAIVLNRYECVLQSLRHLLDFDRPTILCRMDIRNLVAVDVVDLGRCRGADIVRKIRLRIHACRQKAAANAYEHDEKYDHKA